MGWNQRLEDWRTLVELAPAGCFAALDGDRVVATAIGIDYRHCGWIAMMLVAPEYRGRGLGARLLEAAMAALPPELPIRLDATPLGRPLYERHDFVLETSLTRHVRPAVTTTAAVATEVTRLQPADLPEVARIDAAIFGGVRSRLLERIHSAGPEYAWRAGGAPIQYLSRTDRPPVQPDRSDRRDHGRRPRSHSPRRRCPTRAATPLSSTLTTNTRNSRPGWVRQASKPSARSIACGGPARLRLTPGVRAPLTEFAILGPEFG